jgi:ABC-type proline/glycine betaine transport system permease subunit
MVDHRTILAGALPAAGLAIIADTALGALERRLVPPR